MICGTYKLSQTRRERADARDEPLASCVHSELTTEHCVCVCGDARRLLTNPAPHRSEYEQEHFRIQTASPLLFTN